MTASEFEFDTKHTRASECPWTALEILRLHDTVEDNDDIRFEDLESIFGLDVRRSFPQLTVHPPWHGDLHVGKFGRGRSNGCAA